MQRSFAIHAVDRLSIYWTETTAQISDYLLLKRDDSRINLRCMCADDTTSIADESVAIKTS